MKFSFEQRAILTGSLLGDGTITKVTKANTAAFYKCQKSSRSSYLEWHFDSLKPFSCNLVHGFSSCKNKRYSRTSYYTHFSKAFAKLRNLWYPKGKKIVPKNLSLDPLSLSIWYCDDGSNSSKNRLITLSTHGFSKKECEFLSFLLKTTFDIESSVPKKKNIILVRCKHHEKFIEVVSPFIVWDCFKYKTILKPRKQRRYLTVNGEMKKLSEYATNKIKGYNISARLRNGWDVERAITTPVNYDKSTLITAFGETKTINNWLDDERCKSKSGYSREVESYKIIRRLKKGWSPENAVSNPTFGKVNVAAFGESKSISQWALDKRCVVPYKCLYKRLKNGWEKELAISTPSRKI